MTVYCVYRNDPYDDEPDALYDAFSSEELAKLYIASYSNSEYAVLAEGMYIKPLNVKYSVRVKL